MQTHTAFKNEACGRFAAKRGDDVVVNGFGRFAVKERSAREGRNPATGAPLQIPASKSLGFKMSKPVGATL